MHTIPMLNFVVCKILWYEPNPQKLIPMVEQTLTTKIKLKKQLTHTLTILLKRDVALEWIKCV